MSPRKKAEDAQPDFNSTLSTIRKSMQIGSFDDFDDVVPEPMTTGNIYLDSATGIGGYPTRKITELLGPPSSGKTTSALSTAAGVQAAGGRVLYLDFEAALDPDYCEALGLDVHDSETFFYARPDTFEQGANAFREVLKTGEIRLVVCDSVAAMITEAELNGLTGKATMADRAKMMHQFCRQIRGPIVKYNCGVIFINHLLDLVDITPMGQQMAAKGIKRTTSPGGQAVPFYASMRVQFKQMGNLKATAYNPLTGEDDDMVTQTKVQATVVKNKVAEPFKSVELRSRFGKGFSNEHSVLSVLMSYGKIKKSGAWYKFPDPDLRLDDDHVDIQGEEQVLRLMEENKSWMTVLETEARAMLSKDDSVIATVDVQGDEDTYALSIAELSQEDEDATQD